MGKKGLCLCIIGILFILLSELLVSSFWKANLVGRIDEYNIFNITS